MAVNPAEFFSQEVALYRLKKLRRIFPSIMAATLWGLMAKAAAAQTLLTALEQEMRQLVQAAKPSVVTILATTAKEKKEGGGLFGLFGGREEDAQEVKVGSGLIVSSDGFIVTKASVVQDAQHIEITLADEQSLRAELVSADSASGVAVLKIHGEKWTPAKIGSINSVQAGSWVTVIGNALGMPQAVSVGVVSVVHPSGALQISANVDPGSNGSPVFNAEGNACGIVTGRVSLHPDGTIPENYFSCTVAVYPLALCLPQLRESIRQYYETRGWLGVTVVADSKDQRRPKVLSIAKDGPAERAGVQVGDVLTHFTGQPIESFTKLPEMVAACKPGGSESLRVIRGDSVIDFIVPIGPQMPVALAELQPATETDQINSENSRPAIQEKFKLENFLLRQRLQALEKEMQQLRSLQRKQ
jgi:serine protease Do